MLFFKYIIGNCVKICELLLDAVIPRSKEVALSERLTSEEIRDKIPESKETPESFIHSVLSYRNPLAKTLIWQLKYRGSKKVSGKLGEILYEEIIDYLANEAQFLGTTEKDGKILIIPLPMSRERLRERGWNQTEMLVDAIKPHCDTQTFLFRKDILIKVRNTPRQSHMNNKEERLKNLSGSFVVKDPPAVFRKNIILIDDVTTTGATLREARAALLSCGARSVTAFTVAH